MAVDWAANVKKYVPDADDEAIRGIIRHCGIALTKPDAPYIAFSNPAETKRVRENFLKKKLRLTDGDAALDRAIAAVGAEMADDRAKNRVTVYYLLAARYGKLPLFYRKAYAAAASGAGEIAGAALAETDSLAQAAASGASPAEEIAATALESATVNATAGLGTMAGGSAAGAAGLTGSASIAPLPATKTRGWLWLLAALGAVLILLWFATRPPAKAFSSAVESLRDSENAANQGIESVFRSNLVGKRSSPGATSASSQGANTTR